MRLRLAVISGVVALVALGGCARAARDTSGFALETRGSVNASFEDTWHAVKAVLRENEYDIYTRDKRGVFVAYTKHKRSLILQPHRVKYTIELGEVTDAETDVVIETVNQTYGVTLLTDPDWHDRPAKTDEVAQTLLAAVQAKATGQDPAAVMTEDAAVGDIPPGGDDPAPVPAQPVDEAVELPTEDAPEPRLEPTGNTTN